MSRADEYLRRMRALGYEPSLAGMDDGDIEWELAKMDGGREMTTPLPGRTVYRPVDPGLAARIFRMFGQPYDESAIPKGQEFYLNGWDDGEDDSAAGNPLRTMEERPARGGAMFTSQGAAYRPLSYTAGGNDANTGGQGTITAGANRPASWYAEGGAYGNATLPEGAQQQPKQYVSTEQLKEFGWQNVNDGMVRDLNNAMGKYDITTPARIRHFLAQCAKETDKGEHYTEQDYGDKTYFKRMYEGREELGNVYPGDGEKFIGGGGIHITGRDEYQKFADYVGDQEVMNGGAEYVAKKYPWVAAGRWWEKNRMNELVDSLKGEDHDADVERVTRRVNGEPDWDDPEQVEIWLRSLQERQEHYKRSRDIFKE